MIDLGIKVIDDFCPCFSEHKKQALEAHYVPKLTFAGIVYPDLAASDSAHWAKEKFSNVLGHNVSIIFEFFRKYKKGTQQNTFIHSDLSM